MRLPRVTTKITALGDGEKSFEAVFLVDTRNRGSGIHLHIPGVEGVTKE